MTRLRLQLPFRRKFLAVLCAIALGPLIIVAALNIRALTALGTQLATQVGQALSTQTRAGLEQLAADYTGLIAQQRHTLELLVRLQAREVEQTLNQPVPNHTTLFWVDDFAARNPTLELKQLPNEYFQQSAPNEHTAIEVSLKHLVFFTPEGVMRDTVMSYARRLANLAPYFALTRNIGADSAYWRYVSLEAGLHASYPGHGGYPVNYDPREREWYRLQKQTRGLNWSPPHTDVTSHLRMTSVTYPLFSPAGEFLGVTGIDVRLTRLLGAVHLPSHLSTNSHVFLTRLDDSAESPAIDIIARQDRMDVGGDWQEKLKLDRFYSDNPEDTAVLLSAMRASRNGFMHTRYREQNVYCVYRRFDEHGTYLVFTVPTQAAMRPAAEAAEYVLITTRRHTEALLLVALTAIALVAFTGVLISRWITEPIARLSRAVRAVASGDFNAQVDIQSGDEFENLGQHFNRMIPQLEANTHMRQALALAREVQQSLLPHSPPADSVLDIYGECRYADETGGDYFDYLDLRSNGQPLIAVAIGDVSGHGIASSLLMTSARAVLHTAALQPHKLGDTLRQLNHALFEHSRQGWFMTFTLLVFDLESRQVHWVSAGHAPIQNFCVQGNLFTELSSDDIPLGVDRAWQYGESRSQSFAVDDLFVLTTDGMLETTSPQGEQFGKNRLRQTICVNATFSAHEICSKLMREITAFRADARQRDDLTAVVIKILDEPLSTPGC